MSISRKIERVITKSSKKEPSIYELHKEIVKKYDLKSNWIMYSNITPPKRGRQRESFSDAKNTFMRASIDKIFSTDGSLRESWRVIASIFDGNCYLCGEKIYSSNGTSLPDTDIQADHIVPPAVGGSISAGNMAPAHRICNDRKGDIQVEEYLKNKPESLQKIKDFQKMYGYRKPKIQEFKIVSAELYDIWDDAMSRIVELERRFKTGKLKLYKK